MGGSSGGDAASVAIPARGEHAADRIALKSGMPSHDINPKLVAQHARTSQLLGVDFVPAYRANPARADTPEADAAQRAVLVEAKPQRAPAPPAAPDIAAPNTAAPDSAAPARALTPEQARAQQALDALRARYEEEAPHKPFIETYTNIVFGEGDPRARLMFIGEAPGEQEDLSGRPFVGRAGQLLEKMINAMGLARADVYIANVMKVRPPNNATPTTEEALASAPFLYEQIDIVRPEAIVTLGLPSTRIILSSDATMASMRGVWATFTTPAKHTIPVMPTYHPAYLLRAYTTENRAKVWSDLLKVVEKLGLQRPKD